MQTVVHEEADRQTAVHVQFMSGMSTAGVMSDCCCCWGACLEVLLVIGSQPLLVSLLLLFLAALEQLWNQCSKAVE